MNVDLRISHTRKSQSSVITTAMNNYAILQSAADSAKAMSNQFPLNDDLKESVNNAQSVADSAHSVIQN